MNELTQYFKMLELGGKSAQTIRVYRKDLDKFFSYFSISTFAELKKLKVSDFHSFYESQSNLSPVSMNGLIRSLSAFFSWVKDTYHFESEFFNVKFGKTRFVKAPKVKRMILTEEESVRLIKAGDSIQTRFMLALMLFTGIRRDEVSKIQMTDISGCQITINGKGSKQRNVFMDDVICTMLNAYLAERKTNSNYLFYGTRGEAAGDGNMLSGTAIYGRVKAAGEKSGIPAEKIAQLSPHKLRRTAGTRIAMAFDIPTASKVLGHSNLSTTMIYMDDDTIVKNALLGQRSKGMLGE